MKRGPKTAEGRARIGAAARPANPEKSARKLEIVEKCRTRTLDDVGKEYGITRQRVQQICVKAGMMDRHGRFKWRLSHEQRRIYTQGRRKLHLSRDEALARAIVPGAVFQRIPHPPRSAEHRANLVAAAARPEYRAKKSASAKKAWQDPNKRAARIAGMAAYWARVRAGEIPNPRANRAATSPCGASLAGPVRDHGGAGLSQVAT